MPIYGTSTLPCAVNMPNSEEMSNRADICYDELKPCKALQYFKTGVNACVLPPARPEGGDVYLFTPEDDLKKGQYYNSKSK